MLNKFFNNCLILNNYKNNKKFSMLKDNIIFDSLDVTKKKNREFSIINWFFLMKYNNLLLNYKFRNIFVNINENDDNNSNNFVEGRKVKKNKKNKENLDNKKNITISNSKKSKKEIKKYHFYSIKKKKDLIYNENINYKKSKLKYIKRKQILYSNRVYFFSLKKNVFEKTDKSNFLLNKKAISLEKKLLFKNFFIKRLLFENENFIILKNNFSKKKEKSFLIGFILSFLNIY